MRPNAGIANRQGDVDLRFAQFSTPPPTPPVNTLAWLGLAWLGLGWIGLDWIACTVLLLSERRRSDQLHISCILCQ